MYNTGRTARIPGPPVGGTDVSAPDGGGRALFKVHRLADGSGIEGADSERRRPENATSIGLHSTMANLPPRRALTPKPGTGNAPPPGSGSSKSEAAARAGRVAAVTTPPSGYENGTEGQPHVRHAELAMIDHQTDHHRMHNGLRGTRHDPYGPSQRASALDHSSPCSSAWRSRSCLGPSAGRMPKRILVRSPPQPCDAAPERPPEAVRSQPDLPGGSAVNAMVRALCSLSTGAPATLPARRVHHDPPAITRTLLVGETMACCLDSRPHPTGRLPEEAKRRHRLGMRGDMHEARRPA